MSRSSHRRPSQLTEEEQESADQPSRVQGDAVKMWRRTKDQLENEDVDDFRSWWNERCSAELQPETATTRRIVRL